MNFVSADYVNIDDALKRVGGNFELYKKLLERFVDGSHVTALEGFLADGNITDASRLVHTLKGVAANLSLTKLAESAAQMEGTIKGGADYIPALEDLKTSNDITAQIISDIIA